MAGGTDVVVVVDPDEEAAFVAGRAVGGLIVPVTVVVGVVSGDTNVDGGDACFVAVAFASCTECTDAAGRSAPEHPAQARTMTAPTVLTTILRLIRDTAARPVGQGHLVSAACRVTSGGSCAMFSVRFRVPRGLGGGARCQQRIGARG
jgi:hypothetical protein